MAGTTFGTTVVYDIVEGSQRTIRIERAGPAARVDIPWADFIAVVEDYRDEVPEWWERT